MIRDLNKLVRFKTVVGNHSENDRALRWIESELGNNKLYIKKYKSNKYSSLVITTQNTKKPKIFLAAHLDVARADHGLFMPKIKGDRIYGRGVYDMKYAIACYMKLLKELGSKSSNYDFGVMITTDEECGGENGTKHLFSLGYDCGCAFLPDGSENWKLETAAKGVWCYEIESFGKAAHPSLPWEADNALENIIDYLCELRKHFKKEPCGDPDHIHSTIDINEFNTGKTGDNLPDYAEAMVDIFFTDRKEYQRLIKLEKEVRSKYQGLKVCTTIFNPCVKMPKINPFADVFYKIADEKYGIKKKTMFTHGTSDIHYFTERGIYVIETRPKGGGFHGNNEWMDIKDLEKFYEVMKEFIIRTTKTN